MSENKYMTADELNINNHLCVLPYGSENDNFIAEWTAKDLKPLQYYLVNDKPVDTMFKGLIFNPISGRDNHYINPMYADFGELAQFKDWQIALKRLFLSECNFDAAAKNLENGDKVDIWVVLPYPFSNQTEFKNSHDVHLDFSKLLPYPYANHLKSGNLNFKIEDDRYKAIEYWIENFLWKWDNAKHLHDKLTFRGFVWPRASIDSGDEGLVKRVTAFIKKNKYLSMWLQQYGSTGCINWKEFGFDASCTHPNFYGKTGPDFSWIANSTVFAQYYHLGMQITYGKGVLFKENHLQDYLNYGVYNNYMKDSLLVFQFPNQTMREIYENHPIEYNYLYSFIKGNYEPVYPTAAFPS